jgi:hypothetical protein
MESRRTLELAVQPMKVVTCACGQQWRGTDAELVALVQQHGRDVHNMPVTPEQVMAMAVVDDGPPNPSARSA